MYDLMKKAGIEYYTGDVDAQAVYFVDCQDTFCLPDASLTTKNGYSIVSDLQQLADAAEGKGLRKIASLDLHFMDNPELDVNEHGLFGFHAMHDAYNDATCDANLVIGLRQGYTTIQNQISEGTFVMYADTLHYMSMAVETLNKNKSLYCDSGDLLTGPVFKRSSFLHDLKTEQDIAKLTKNLFGSNTVLEKFALEQDPHYIRDYVDNGADIILEKQQISIATAPNSLALLMALKESGMDSVLAGGFYTEWCDVAAILTMQALGIQVYLVEGAHINITDDNGKSIFEDRTIKAYEKMKDAGVEFITLEHANQII